MKTKRNTKSKVHDVIVVLICLTGMAVSLWTFWKELNETLTKQSETPIGEVVFKRKSARRKFADTVMWDRLKQTSPIYNGDTIRTAALSQANIYFADNAASIELIDNSIVQVWLNEKGEAVIDLASGNISVDKQDSAGSLTLRSGRNEIAVEAGSRINVQSDAEEALNLTVIEGSASLTNEQESRIIDAGSALKISSEGRAESFITVVNVIGYPASYKQEVTRNNIPAQFIWNAVDLAADEIVRLEISRDKAFSSIIKSADAAASEGGTILTLDSAGTYYWRIYPASAGNYAKENASSGKFAVAYSEPPRLIAPSEGYAYQYRTKKPEIRMYWTAQEEASGYRVEIADNSQMNNPEIIIVNESSMTYSGLDAGDWYWRVTPLYPGGFITNTVSSNAGRFRIEQTREIHAPEPLVTVSEPVFYTEEENISAYLSWKHNPEAASYNIQISSSSNLENPILSETLTGNFYSYNTEQNELPEGKFYWAVSMTDSEGNKSPLSESNSFLIMKNKAEAAEYTATFPSDNSIDETEIQDAVPVEAEPPLTEATTTKEAIPTVEEKPPVKAKAEQPSVLPAVKETASTNNHVFGIDELTANKGINFKWQPVPEADRYIFNLYMRDSSGKLTNIIENRALSGTSFDLKDLSILDTGDFVWRVEAQSLASDGSVEKRGKAAEFSFSVDLPEIGTIETEELGTMYGN